MNDELQDKTGNRWIARSYISSIGASAAYVLALLAMRQRGATKRLPGEKGSWFFNPVARAAKAVKANRKDKSGRDTYRPIADAVPWLSERAILDIIRKNLESGKHIKIRKEAWHWLNGNTLHYQVSKQVCEAVKKAQDDVTGSQVRWFDPAEAETLRSINAALVLNLIYRDFHLKVKHEDQRLVFSRRAIAEDLGLPPSTVNAVFKLLEEKIEGKQYLSGCDCSAGRAYKLLVPNPSKQKGYGAGRRSVSTLITTIAEVNTAYNPMAAAPTLLTWQTAFMQCYLVLLYFAVIAEEHRTNVLALAMTSHARVKPAAVTPKKRRKGEKDAAAKAEARKEQRRVKKEKREEVYLREQAKEQRRLEKLVDQDSREWRKKVIADGKLLTELRNQPTANPMSKVLAFVKPDGLALSV